jgi:hypothetical protein
LSGKTARGETEATASGGEPGGKPRPAASITPIFAPLSRIKSVIGIKYPKIKFFLEAVSRRTIPRLIRPRRRLARVHEEQRSNRGLAPTKDCSFLGVAPNSHIGLACACTGWKARATLDCNPVSVLQVQARQNISLPGDKYVMADRVSDTNLRFLEKPGAIKRRWRQSCMNIH